ncbi:MAG TPA: glycoside hydrolase family 88 protein [Opitutus sp.]|nr:glycoside hydrolase family 88 protein [Opitutus sp.]
MKTQPRLFAAALALLAGAAALHAQSPAPDHATPYPPATPAEIKAVLDRVFAYVDATTPVRVVDRDTDQPVTDLAHLPPHPAFAPTDFYLTSYEWGVTYSGMLLAAEATGDARYRDYVANRLETIAPLAARLRDSERAEAGAAAPALEAYSPKRILTLRPILHPHSLDDSGSMCAALIKAARAGLAPGALRPWIDNYMRWISGGQFRLADGTLARQGPYPDTLWLDDLYMSVPALAQMGALTGETRYFDDAAKQIRQFSARMFVAEKGLYRHGWVQAMNPHPAFCWARANGWALVAMTELLSVLPSTHPAYPAILAQYRAHVAGLAAVQSSTGLWHQLLDRNDSYLETSASAMYTYAIARGVNRGWLDATAYGPVASLAWNAVAQRVNPQGQVEGTCVGTGMGFDPAFYYHRPTSVHAAHGYGPVLLAGAEMIVLRKGVGAGATVHGGGVEFPAVTSSAAAPPAAK